MDAKASKAFSSIKQGLNEALTFTTGSENTAVIHKFIGTETKELPEKKINKDGNGNQ